MIMSPCVIDSLHHLFLLCSCHTLESQNNLIKSWLWTRRMMTVEWHGMRFLFRWLQLQRFVKLFHLPIVFLWSTFFIYYVRRKWILQVKTNLQSIMKYPITLRICNTILRQYFRNLSLTTSNNLCKNLKYLFLKYMIHTSNACTEKVINLLLYSCFHETLKELA